MSFPTARVAKYDAQKEKEYETSLRTPYDPSLFPMEMMNPMIDRTTMRRAVEWDQAGKVAYGVSGGGSILFKYDPKNGTEGKITTLAKMCDGKFLGSKRQDLPYSTLAFAVDSRNQKIYFAPSSRNYSFGEMS